MDETASVGTMPLITQVIQLAKGLDLNVEQVQKQAVSVVANGRFKQRFTITITYCADDIDMRFEGVLPICLKEADRMKVYELLNLINGDDGTLQYGRFSYCEVRQAIIFTDKLYPDWSDDESGSEVSGAEAEDYQFYATEIVVTIEGVVHKIEQYSHAFLYILTPGVTPKTAYAQTVDRQPNSVSPKFVN